VITVAIDEDNENAAEGIIDAPVREQRAVTSSTGSDGLHAKRPNVGIDQQHMDCPRGEKSEKIGEEEAD
jgi:hypothetical protein